MHAVAGIAILFAAVIAVRVGIHLGGAFSDSLIGLVALEAGFLGGGLELAVGVAGRAVERGVRTIDRDRGGMSAGCKTKGQDDGCQIRLQKHVILLVGPPGFMRRAAGSGGSA